MQVQWCFPLLLLVLLADEVVRAVKQENLYEILGVREDADDGELTAAYKKQALKWQPHRHAGKIRIWMAEQRLKYVANAYETLSDPEKRRVYDQARQHDQVRVLLSSNGTIEELPGMSQGSGDPAARWRYIGGKTRLVGLTMTNNFRQFLQQLNKATSCDENCRWVYELPSEGGVLIDLVNDDDLEMMWEELNSVMAVRPTFRLHLYTQLGSTSILREDSSCAMPHTDGNGMKERTSTGTTPDTAAASAHTAAGTSSAGGDGIGQQRNSTVAFETSEAEDLVEDLVTKSPKPPLSDLGSGVEIIKPEDPQSSEEQWKQGGAGGIELGDSRYLARPQETFFEKYTGCHGGGVCGRHTHFSGGDLLWLGVGALVALFLSLFLFF